MNTETENIEMNENDKVDMKSMVSCINSLTRKGYVTQFRATPAGLMSLTTEKIFQPHEIKVPQFYRFEGESNPSDNAILYAIEANDGEKGTLVDGYGTTSDLHITRFMKNVPMEKKDAANSTGEHTAPEEPKSAEQEEPSEHVSWIENALDKINKDFPLSGGETDKDLG